MAFGTELVLAASKPNPYASSGEKPIVTDVTVPRSEWFPLDPHGLLPDGSYGPVTLGAVGAATVSVVMRVKTTSGGTFLVRANGGTQYSLVKYTSGSLNLYFGSIAVPAGPINVEVFTSTATASYRRTDKFYATVLEDG